MNGSNRSGSNTADGVARPAIGPAPENDTMTYDEASRFLGVPKGTLYTWVHARCLPHYRLGPRLVRFSRKALASWLAEREVTP